MSEDKKIDLEEYVKLTEDEKEKTIKDFLGISSQECPKCHSKKIDCPAWGGLYTAYECDDCGYEWETKEDQVIKEERNDN